MYRKLPRPPRQPRMIRMSDQTRGMTVTGIEPYPKGKGRVSVYLNDEFAFVLYKGELSQYDLDIGKNVNDELYDRIMSETLYPRAKKRAMSLLKTMDRTEADVRRKLSEGGYPSDAVDVAVDYLKSYHYIDDSRYAAEYIRFKSSSMSRKQIIAKLTEKGVPKAVILESYDAFEEENGESANSSERELVEKLIKKRHPNGVGDIDYNSKQKLFAYLYGKGFSISLIEEVYSSLDIT